MTKSISRKELVDWLEIIEKKDKKYIEVWLSNQEQQYTDRKKLTKELLCKANIPKCKVIYFLSGSDELTDCMEGLLVRNIH